MRNIFKSIMKAVGLTLVLLVVVGCSNSSRQSAVGSNGAGEFASQVADKTMHGQWDWLYDHLVPEQQALVSHEQYTKDSELATAMLSIVKVDSVKVVKTFPEMIQIPGTQKNVNATGVTIRMKASGLGQSSEEENPMYVVKVNGAWCWILDENQIKGFTS